MRNPLIIELIRISITFGILSSILTSFAQASPIYDNVLKISILADSLDIIETQDSAFIRHSDRDIAESDNKISFSDFFSNAVDINTSDNIADMEVDSDTGFLTKVLDADNRTEYEVSDRKSIDLSHKDSDKDWYSVQAVYQQSLSEKAEIQLGREEVQVAFVDLTEPTSDIESDSMIMRIFGFLAECIEPTPDSALDNAIRGLQKIFGITPSEKSSKKKP